MFRTISTLVVATTLLSVPTIARAAESGAPAALEATVVCRPATAKEHGNAMMMAGHAMMMCKPIAFMKPTANGNEPAFGPDLSKTLTPEQIDAAWRTWVEKQLSVLPAGV